MKKIMILIIFLMAISSFGQSSQSWEDKQIRRQMENRNGFPEPPNHPTSPWLFNRNEVNSEIVNSDVPRIFRQPKGLSKEEKEDLKKQEAAMKSMRMPSPEDTQKYSSFLAQKNTGIFRLFPDLGCETQFTVDINDDCSQLITLSKSYSFARKDYGDDYFYDLRLKDEKLFADGFLSQSIITNIGDVSLENITLQSKGMKFLVDFKPETLGKKFKEQFIKVAGKISNDGFNYGKIVKLTENTTYLARLISYQVSNKNIPSQNDKITSKEERLLTYIKYDKRRDKIISFRIIRKADDGSVTILWKELFDTKAARIKFEKGEKITNLKLS